MLKLLIKLAILGGVIYATHLANPPFERHINAIAERQAARSQRNTLAQVDTYNTGNAPEPTLDPEMYDYKDYFLFSTVKRGEVSSSFGIFRSVFVYNTDL